MVEYVICFKLTKMKQYNKLYDVCNKMYYYVKCTISSKTWHRYKSWESILILFELKKLLLWLATMLDS